jgi:hypothetical protein
VQKEYLVVNGIKERGRVEGLEEESMEEES